MPAYETDWLAHILTANAKFCERIETAKLPTERSPGTIALITCMDPRINLEAVGLLQFAENGEGDSTVRVIRTIGAAAEERSLIIGMFLAGIREIAVLMHTDCGCCAAFSRINTIVENMNENVDESNLKRFKEMIGEPFAERLRKWLKALPDVRDAVRREVEDIRQLPFAPRQLVVHGLVYELASGHVEVVVNGYQDTN